MRDWQPAARRVLETRLMDKGGERIRVCVGLGRTVNSRKRSLSRRKSGLNAKQEALLLW